MTSALRKPLRPFIFLMGRLSYPRKMALVAVIFLVPLLAFLCMLLTEINSVISLAERQREGIAFNQKVAELLRVVQQQRGLFYLSALDSAVRQRVLSLSSLTDEVMADIENSGREFFTSPEAGNSWQGIRKQWNSLRDRGMSMSPEEHFEASSALVSEILSLMHFIRSSCSLFISHGVDIHPLVTTLSVKLPRMVDKTALARGIGTVAAVNRAITDDRRAELIAISGQVRFVMERVRDDVGEALKENGRQKVSLDASFKDVSSTHDAFLKLLAARVARSRVIDVEPGLFFESGTQAVESCFRLQNTIARTLDTIFAQRIGKLNWRKYTIAGFAGGTIFLILLLFAGFSVSVTDSVSALVNASDRASKGDLSSRATVRGNDEMSMIAEHFNWMADALGRSIHQMRESEERAVKAMLEKEILLKEVHHRVKNNLQLISSLLNLQSFYVQDERVLRMFSESRHRIRAMAVLHEILYRSEDMTQINCEAYMDKVIAELFRSHGVSPKDVRLRTDIRTTHLSFDTAIYCGLIVNELVSNSLKHAFPGGRTGEISVGFHNDETGRHTLTVNDNGIGLPPDYDISSANTLGLQLVTTLVQQLDASLEIDRSRGTSFKIEFNEPG